MRFLFVAQTPSKNTSRLRDAALQSLSSHASAQSDVICKSPLDVRASDLLSCDGLLIGCLENIGALSGLTKDMFDRCYNKWLGQTQALPVGIYIRAGLDGTATKNALNSICGGLKWRLIAAPLIVRGNWQDSFCDQVSELCLGVVLGIDSDIY